MMVTDKINGKEKLGLFTCFKRRHLKIVFENGGLMGRSGTGSW